MNRHNRQRARARLRAAAQPADHAPDTDRLGDAVRRHPWSSLTVGATVGLLLGLSPELRKNALAALLHLTK